MTFGIGGSLRVIRRFHSPFSVAPLQFAPSLFPSIPMISAPPIIIAASAVDAFVEQFGLAWGKFLAQVIIFLIVYTVLKKFAFGPILGMLEQRRQRIADGEAKL